MSAQQSGEQLRKLAFAGIMAALCYVGYAVFPAFSLTGTKIHIGNAFVVLGALLLGPLYGGLAGAVGLTIADLTTGFAESAPRTFIAKLLIGIVVGLVAHKLASLGRHHERRYIIKWTTISTLAGMIFNCFFEPALKYVWYSLLDPNTEKASKALAVLMGITTYATVVNAVINSIIAILLYVALRPALLRAGLLTRELLEY